jgi:hypothetical protein
MSTTESYGLMPVSTVVGFIADMQAAAKAALGPARSLSAQDGRARTLADKLAGAFNDVEVLYMGPIERRAALERDNRRIDILRPEWAAFGDSYRQRAGELNRQISTQPDELEDALEAQALPVSADPMAVLVARQEIELSLKVAHQQDKPLLVAMLDLAGQGGDIAAAAASDWGQLTYVAAAGTDSGFDAVRDAAIASVLTSGDAGRGAAAKALQAINGPVPGKGTAAALYTACLYGQQILEAGTKVVQSGPMYGRATA